MSARRDHDGADDERDPDEDFRRIVAGNDWSEIPGDHEDLEPWAEQIEWQPLDQPTHEIPEELLAADEDEDYDPDPGELTRGMSPAMVRALTVILAVFVIMTGLALLPGPLPTAVWALGVAALIGGLYLVFRALPEDPRDDDGAVV